MNIVFSLFGWAIWSLLSWLLAWILYFLDAIAVFMLKPFSFSTDMFVAILGADTLNSVEGIMSSAGIAISILLLVGGLFRVFSGRLDDDVPNPFSLIAKFLLAIFANYWIITLIVEYLFPFAQKFFNNLLKINSSSNDFSSIGVHGAALYNNLINPSNTSFVDGLSDSGAIGKIATFGGDAIHDTIGGSVGIILFLICVIAATINIFKLVVENAERYFTMNVLILAGPLASSTIVSEKTSKIFKSWLQAILATVLTIVFNVIGFKFVLMAFSNCFNVWAKTGKIEQQLIALISLVAVSKMAQKFDQMVSMIVFKINPIQNRSLLMTTMGTIGAYEKSRRGLVGAIQRGKGYMNGAKQGIQQMIPGFGKSKASADRYDSKLTDSSPLKSLGTAVNSDLANAMKNVTGKDPDKLLYRSFGSATIPSINNGNGLDFNNLIQKATNKGEKPLTEDVAKGIIESTNANLKNGYMITGFNPQNNVATIGRTADTLSKGVPGTGLQADTLCHLVNSNGNDDRYYNQFNIPAGGMKQGLSDIAAYGKDNGLQATVGKIDYDSAGNAKVDVYYSQNPVSFMNSQDFKDKK